MLSASSGESFRVLEVTRPRTCAADTRSELIPVDLVDGLAFQCVWVVPSVGREILDGLGILLIVNPERTGDHRFRDVPWGQRCTLPFDDHDHLRLLGARVRRMPSPLPCSFVEKSAAGLAIGLAVAAGAAAEPGR